MKPLLEVARDTSAGMALLYLRYAPAQPVARTLSITETESIAIDLDANGDVLGVELLAPQAAEFETLAAIAEERDLSLDGLFPAA
jgi:uncharacterized protein YuzE